jgi:hypothetical protein
VFAILEHVHQIIMVMLRTAELDMADTDNESDIADFLTNAAWTVCSTYHTVLKTLPGAAIFGRDMLFDVPFLAEYGNTDKNKRTRILSKKTVPV